MGFSWAFVRVSLGGMDRWPESLDKSCGVIPRGSEMEAKLHASKSIGKGCRLCGSSFCITLCVALRCAALRLLNRSILPEPSGSE